MTIHYGKCQKCGRYDVIGTVGCVRKDLCPDCASPHVGIGPDTIRNYCKAVLAKQTEGPQTL